jgi:hypothetical protein
MARKNLLHCSTTISKVSHDRTIPETVVSKRFTVTTHKIDLCSFSHFGLIESTARWRRGLMQGFKEAEHFGISTHETEQRRQDQ